MTRLALRTRPAAWLPWLLAGSILWGGACSPGAEPSGSSNERAGAESDTSASSPSPSPGPSPSASPEPVLSPSPSGESGDELASGRRAALPRTTRATTRAIDDVQEADSVGEENDDDQPPAGPDGGSESSFGSFDSAGFPFGTLSGSQSDSGAGADGEDNVRGEDGKDAAGDPVDSEKGESGEDGDDGDEGDEGDDGDD